MRGLLLVGVFVLACLSAAAVQPPLGAPATTPAPATAPASKPEPNFIVIFLDDLRTDELVAMPYTSAVIGARGATFDHAYAPYPLCCPARATILSGRYPHNNHVLGNVPPAGGVSAFDHHHTIGTWLKRQGYRTAYIGKYLNRYGVDTPRRHRPRGWSTWSAMVTGVFNYRNFAVNVDRVLVRYRDAYQTEVMGDLATDFIRRPRDHPFLMVTAFLAPHSGDPPEPDDTRGRRSCFYADLCENTTPAVSERYRDSEAGHPMRRTRAYNEADVSDKPSHIQARRRFGPDHAAAHQEVWEQRLESIHAVDDQIRRIVRALRGTGAMRRTYILVTSDNGFLLGEHRIPFGKVHPYEPSSRIPMLLRGPGIPAGTHVEQLVGLHDIAPTVLRATGNYGVQTQELDGVSLLPLTADSAAHARRDLVLEAGPTGDALDEGAVRGSSPGARVYRGIRTDTGWKYIWYATTREVELYNLNTDPEELNNLAADPAYEERLVGLARAARRLATCVGRACVRDAAR